MSDEIARLRKKVAKYEHFLHNLQLYAEVMMDGKKAQRLVDNACRWSYAHRIGNGEMSDEEQQQLIDAAFEKLTDVD